MTNAFGANIAVQPGNAHIAAAPGNAFSGITPSLQLDRQCWDTVRVRENMCIH